VEFEGLSKKNAKRMEIFMSDTAGRGGNGKATPAPIHIASNAATWIIVIGALFGLITLVVFPVSTYGADLRL
jgi:hypothetical protein